MNIEHSMEFEFDCSLLYVRLASKYNGPYNEERTHTQSIANPRYNCLFGTIEMLFVAIAKERK